MSKYIVIMTIALSVILTGCAGAMPSTVSLNLPTPPGAEKPNVLQAQGDGVIVERTVETSTEKTFQSAKSIEAMKHELEMEKEHTKQVKAQARAANPCGGCFMVQSGCYAPGAPCGPINNGLYIGGHEGGYNGRY